MSEAPALRAPAAVATAGALPQVIQRLRAWGLRVRDELLVAGPCSVESEAQILETAKALAAHDVTVMRGGVWKPRTHPGGFEGLGTPALAWLKRAGDAAGLPVATEVATPAHVERCLEAGIDVLWIGARTTTDPFAVQGLADALAGVDVPVLVKNPMNPDLDLWIGALERLLRAGLRRIVAVHRGFSTWGPCRYRNDPLWRIPLELRRRMPELPLVCDPSHMSGTTLHVPALARMAMDLRFDGLMVEVHLAPEDARSDAEQQLTPAQYGCLVSGLHRDAGGAREDVPAELAALRTEIDAIDHGVLGLLARRMECAARIGVWKRARGLSPSQPDRWDAVREDRLRLGADLGLSWSFARDTLERIHAEALEVQRRLPDAAVARTTEDHVVLVDASDARTGTAPKLEAHRRGLLHRAFSVFLYDASGRMLLQQRALGKYHSGGLWSNTCCSHPRPGEDTAAAAARRLREEMGIGCPLEPAFEFVYRARLPGGLVEHELDHVFVGRFDGVPAPDPREVAAWRWAEVEEVRAEQASAPERFSVWFRVAFERLHPARATSAG